jgi:hypothetical protein
LNKEGKRQVDMASDYFEKLYSEEDMVLDRRVKKMILKNMGRDFVIGVDIGADCSINSMVVPVLYEKAQFQDAPGFFALKMAVADFSRLGWDVIADLRKEESWIQFRHKMKQIDLEARRAFQESGRDEVAQLYATSQKFINELLREIAELQPKVGEAVGNILLEIFLGSVPFVGTGIGAIRSAIEIEESKKSWVATLLRLRGDEARD